MVGSATLLKLCLISPLEKDKRYGRDLPADRNLLPKSRGEVMLNIATLLQGTKDSSDRNKGEGCFNISLGSPGKAPM